MLMMNMKSAFLLAGIVVSVSSVALIQYAYAQSAICCAPGRNYPSDPIHGVSQIAPGIVKTYPSDPVKPASQFAPGHVKNSIGPPCDGC